MRNGLGVKELFFLCISDFYNYLIMVSFIIVLGLCQEVYDTGGSGDPEIIPTEDPQGKIIYKLEP